MDSARASWPRPLVVVLGVSYPRNGRRPWHPLDASRLGLSDRMPTNTVRLIQRFRAAGWSLDRASSGLPDGTMTWCVTARRGKRMVRVEAPLETVALKEAARLARLDELDQEGV